MCLISAASSLWTYILTRCANILQGPEKDHKHSKVEVKAFTMQPAHPYLRVEQVYLPMMSGEASK